MDSNTKLIGAGLTGTLVLLVCCFTPVLVIAFTALGFAAYIAKLDYVLIPLLLASVVLVVVGLVRRTWCAPRMPQ
jgi:mercuric ion transport protein